jgi:hypothetical protein
MEPITPYFGSDPTVGRDPYVSATQIYVLDCPPWHQRYGNEIFTAIIVVLVLIILYYLFRPHIATRLAKEGWVLYTMEDCVFCVKQLWELGSVTYPLHVKCGKNKKLKAAYGTTPPIPCSKVTAFPFWYNAKTKETRTGLQTRSELRKMAR